MILLVIVGLIATSIFLQQRDQIARAAAEKQARASAAVESLRTANIVSVPEIVRALEVHNVETRPVWRPMHTQPLFAQSARVGGAVAESLYENGLCLPSSSSLTIDDQQRVRLGSAAHRKMADEFHTQHGYRDACQYWRRRNDAVWQSKI